MLDKIKEAQVFAIELLSDSKFKITDGWYSYTMSKEELVELANELLELANGDSWWVILFGNL